MPCSRPSPERAGDVKRWMGSEERTIGDQETLVT